jgi:glycosyltransferase involved in cell wall biosynthesis
MQKSDEERVHDFAKKSGEAGASVGHYKPLVSLVVPGYNESQNVISHLSAICGYMRSLEEQYHWELTFVDDGSRDDTGSLADAFAALRDNVRVVHHPKNLGLSRALKTGFGECRGDYIVTLDLGLKYSTNHIARILKTLLDRSAAIVVASPYARGGKTSNVPWLRQVLSISANRVLSGATDGRVKTVTGMVRAYDAAAVRELLPAARGSEINCELLLEAVARGAKIEEIPAHLDWDRCKEQTVASRTKIVSHALGILLCAVRYWGSGARARHAAV